MERVGERVIRDIAKYKSENQCDVCGGPRWARLGTGRLLVISRKGGLKGPKKTYQHKPTKKGKCEICGGPTSLQNIRCCITCYNSPRGAAHPQWEGGDRPWKLRGQYYRFDRQKGFKEEIIGSTKIKSLLQEPCAYCGSGKGLRGLDRVDNRRGHVEGNVVVACTLCNVVRKNHFSFEEMRDHLGPAIRNIRISRELSLKEPELPRIEKS
jgi:hypothetical protein